MTSLMPPGMTEQEQPLLAQGTVLSQVQQGFVSEQGWQRDSEPAALD